MTLNKVSPVTMYIINLTNSPKHIFSWTMRVIVTSNLILSLTNISPFALTKKEEAAEALQKAQAIAQHYASQHEFSPEGQILSHFFYKAAQHNMNMYCIDVPVSL